MTNDQFERFTDLANHDQLTTEEATELEGLYAISEAQADVCAQLDRMNDQAHARAVATQSFQPGKIWTI